ncbi:MAG: hypothetical protein KAG53_05500 [Endozoicomonadaceae bacterium]|nr:hypothetical protein [Endozoicomonadaceae bacterium]
MHHKDQAVLSLLVINQHRHGFPVDDPVASGGVTSHMVRMEHALIHDTMIAFEHNNAVHT